MSDNFKRMLALVNEFFDTKSDPEQLNVTESVMEHLHSIHPATMNELIEGDGPVVWILVIPTLQHIMEQFLSGKISEQQLADETPVGATYDAIYLCSATVLPEYRHKGLAKKTTIDAINSIRKDHSIRALFYWPFSEDGKLLANAVAKETQLPLLERKQ